MATQTAHPKPTAPVTGAALVAEKTGTAAPAPAASPAPASPKDADEAKRTYTRHILAPDAIVAENDDVPDDVEIGGATAGGRQRSELQQTYDAKVSDLHAKWIARGKPEDFNKSPRKSIVVKVQDREAAHAMLRSAGTFTSTRVERREKNLGNGQVEIFYRATDKLAGRGRKPKGYAVPQPVK